MRKKENWLYFAGAAAGAGETEFDYTVTSTNTGTDWNAADEVQTINVSTLFNGTTQGVTADITDVIIISGVDATNVRGSAYGRLDRERLDTINKNRGREQREIKYTDREGREIYGADDNDVKTGQVTLVTSGGFAISGSAGSEIITIDKPDGDSADSTNGYTLGTGDVVIVRRAPKVGEAACWPADKFLGCSKTNDTTTVIHFMAMKGDEANDTVTITHGSDKNQQIFDMVAMAADGGHLNPGFVRVVDLFKDVVLGDSRADAVNMGITACVIALA